jgi:hypothetical protein
VFEKARTGIIISAPSILYSETVISLKLFSFIKLAKGAAECSLIKRPSIIYAEESLDHYSIFNLPLSRIFNFVNEG